MNRFLSNVARQIKADKRGNYKDVVILTPNRRAGLFLQKELNQLHDQPIWSPRLFTIDDWVRYHSALAEADRLSCIYHLYQIWLQEIRTDEQFENFYFWGDRLIQDFDLIDKYLVNEERLFSTILEEKEIEAKFNDWEDELKAYLSQFWSSIQASGNPKIPGQHEQIKAFLGLWEKLPKLKQRLQASLKDNGLAYSGLMYRELAQNPEQLNEWKAEDIYLVGFNRLNKCEERIIDYCLKKLDANIFWNIDKNILAYKEDFNDAGRFIEQRQRVELEKSLDFASDLLKGPKEIKTYGISQQAGQAKFIGDILSGSEIKPEDTMIILPDESLLLPILGALPDKVTKVNVSMGVALKETPMFSLVESYLKLHENFDSTNGSYHRSDVERLLHHPYLPEENKSFDQIHVSSDLLKDWEFEGIGHFFQKVEGGNVLQLFDYLLNGLKELHPWHAQKNNRGGGLAEYNAEVIVFAHQRIQKLRSIYEEQEMELDFTSLIRLIRHYFRNARIPFKGEPLEGLQILGPLEARNLDFDHLIIPNMNEGIFPGTPANSIIPFHLQKAFRLPTYEDEMAEYAYYFYMSMSRAPRASLLYNLLPDVTGGKEMSRLLQNLDLLDSSHWEIQELAQTQEATLEPAPDISIEKSPEIMRSIKERFDKGVSPSAIHTYIYCQLRYYFHYIEELREEMEVEEGYSSMNIGKVLHKAMELLYDDFEGKVVTEKDIDAMMSLKSRTIDAALKIELGVDIQLEDKGETMLIKRLVMDYVQKVLEYDKNRAPFLMHYHELEIEEKVALNEEQDIYISGRIDRLDEKDGTLTVTDYKTGNVGYKSAYYDFNRIKSVESLFELDSDAHKEALQLFVYAMALRSSGEFAGNDLQVGLYSLQDMFDVPSYNPALYIQEPGKRDVHSIQGISNELLEDVREGILRWTEHLLDPENMFVQTEDKKKCMYCPYNQICKRR